jgi:hypothetical protein
MGLIGGIGGMLAGLFAPKIVIGLYALDGPEPPPAFSPLLWGSQQGCMTGLVFGAGGGLLVFLCLGFVSGRLRMTTRRWMAVVALVAVGMGIVRWEQRRSYGLYWADFHAQLESGIQSDCRPGCPHAAEPYPSRVYHARLRREYERAARYPWVRFPTDPLESRWNH